MENKNEKKAVLGSVYVNKTAKNKQGETFELRVPNYQIQFNMDAVSKINADEEGNIRLSIHERKDSDKLAEEKRPTHYIIENTYASDKKIDLYSVKDIVVNKEELMGLTKKENIGEKEVEKAYVTVRSDGSLQTTTGKYENAKILQGKAFEVDSVNRQVLAAKERMGENEVNLNTVGIAWKNKDKDGKEFYSVSLNDDKIQYLPVDEKKMLQLSLRPLKETIGEKGPTHTIVQNTEFLNGRLDSFAEIDFKVKKADVLSDKLKKEEKQTVNNKEYVTHSTYLNIYSDGNIRPNYKKYPELKESGESAILYGAKAEKVDTEVRKAEIEKRVETAKEKKEVKEEKKENKKNDVKKKTSIKK